MASRIFASRLRSRLAGGGAVLRPIPVGAALHRPILGGGGALLRPSPPLTPSLLRRLSTAARRGPARPRAADIGARARQFQTRRLWTYALTFSCVAGFIVIVLSNFQDQMVFYITPTEALARFAENPANSRFRLGGLVLDGSVSHPSTASPEIEFVVSDLITDILVRYEGSVPDLFREGHSVVVEGYVRPWPEDEPMTAPGSAAEKARSADCYFRASEVLAKHDEKYMPKEVAVAIEKNKKLLEAEAETKRVEADVEAVKKRVEAEDEAEKKRADAVAGGQKKRVEAVVEREKKKDGEDA